MRMLYLNIFIFSLFFTQTQNPFDVRTGKHNSTEELNSDSTGTDAIYKPSRSGVTRNPFDLSRSGSPISDVDVISSVGKQGKSLRSHPIRFLLAIISILIFAGGVSLNRGRFASILKSVINSNYLKTLTRSMNSGADLQTLLFYTLFVLNMASFLHLASFYGYFGDVIPAEISWLIGLLIVVTVYLVRHLAMWLMNYIFPFGPAIPAYNYSVAFHNSVVGVALLPVVLGLQFGPEPGAQYLYYLGLIILGLIYLSRQSKGALLALGVKGFNPMYFFLYLCAIEIAPILVGLRILWNIVL